MKSEVIYRNDAIEAIEHRLAEPQYQHTGEDWYMGMNCAESEIDDVPSAVAPYNDAFTKYIDELLAYEERNDLFNLTTKERAEFQAYVKERMGL